VYQARQFVGDEPFLLMLGDHIYLSAQQRNCAAQLIDHYNAASFQAMSAVQPTPSHLLHLFGTLKGKPVEGQEGLYQTQAIMEKPDPDYAQQHLRSPGLPAGQYLCHFGMHVFPAAIFDALEYHIKNDIREKGEIQLTSSQEYMRTELLKESYGACAIQGKRYDTGIPYGLMESQIALALAGRHRSEIVEAIARLLAEQLQSISKR
jgi:UTP--glucose-1-phosphate uridylyltransferase